MPPLRNPLLPGFHADPSALRVGNDYYIATSTFEWYPGVQIYHSTDLANWSLVCRPLSRAAQLDMRGNPDSCGVWAPCLTHDGIRFWLVYSDVKRKDGSFKDVLNYIVHAPAVTGPWSDPIFANASGFDPSLFHDPDSGRKYFVNMLWDHRKRTTPGTPFSGIMLQEFDPQQGCLVGPRKNIYKGTDLKLVEGPHIYKRNGIYYLMTAEGGTGYDHAVTLARSTPGSSSSSSSSSIWGPYETHPDKHILTSKDHPLAALQRAGHGSIVDVDLPDGSTKPYLVHLCGRPVTQKRRCVLGRETAIQAATWRDDGWLYVDNGPVPSLFVDVPGTRDDSVATADYWQEKRYTFGSDQDNTAVAGTAARHLPADFQWLRTPDPDRIFAVQDNELVLYGRESIGSWFEQALVARRQQHFSFAAETVLTGDYQPADERQFAGLVLYYSRYNFFYLAVAGDETQCQDSTGGGYRELIVMASAESYPDGLLEREPLCQPVRLPSTGDVRLALTVRAGSELQFWYATAATKNYELLTKIGPVYDASVVSDECGGHKEHGSFTGAFVGVAASDLNGTGLPARFREFVYRPTQDARDRYEV